MSALRWSAALALDLAVGEPPASAHPVVFLGRAISALDRLGPRDAAGQRAFGIALVGIPAVLAALAGAATGLISSRILRGLASVWLLKSAFAMRELLLSGDRVEQALRRGDVAAARERLTALVSRDTSELRPDEAASAAIESLAENLADSFIAPLLFYRIGGLPAALAYRAVNTADAMVGYHGKYERIGKAAARLDDALNYVPARISAFALIAAAALTGQGDARGALDVALRDHRRTASPNAGWPMAAAAGALGVRLAKRDHYSLGDGRRPPGPDDIRRARGLVIAASLLATVVVLATYRRGMR
ncbi:MAG TPA: adenosylcobinamide-phosphate synthase CbiB [Candidatus Limnocylindria bacterium]